MENNNNNPIYDYWQWGVAMSFCIRRGIVINPVILGNDKFKISINDNGNIKVGTQIYNKIDFDHKIKELYLYLRDKYTKEYPEQ